MDVEARLAVERQDGIRELLKHQRVVRVDEVAQTLRVSVATVRRDLVDLEQRGWLRRVHGGAVAVDGSLDEPFFDDKAAAAAREKQAIAEAALRLVEPKSTVYLDGGSSVLALARLLQPMAQLTVVTNSLRIAHLYSSGGPRMLLVGGECRRLSQTVVGPLTRSILDDVAPDLAFMGTIALSAANGLFTTDPAEAFTKERAMQRARKVVLLADASKFTRTSFVRFGRADAIDVLITDPAAPPAELEAFRTLGVQVVTA